MTPHWAVERLLEAAYDLPLVRENGMPAYWLEPCAGDGQLIRTANAWGQQYAQSRGFTFNVRWHACEIRPECEEVLKTVANPVIIGDFLKVVPAKYDVVLTNPPFSLAEEFVRACLPIATHVVMLLRLNWLENKDELLREHLADIWVLPNRPVFGRNKHGKVAADAACYAWFHFWPGATGKIRHLARTPKAVRSAYRKHLDETLPRRRDDRRGKGRVEAADGEPGGADEVLHPEAPAARAGVQADAQAASGGEAGPPGQLAEGAAERVRDGEARTRYSGGDGDRSAGGILPVSEEPDAPLPPGTEYPYWKPDDAY